MIVVVVISSDSSNRNSNSNNNNHNDNNNNDNNNNNIYIVVLIEENKVYELATEINTVKHPYGGALRRRPPDDWEIWWDPEHQKPEV